MNENCGWVTTVGLSPTLSVDQRLTNHCPRSRVGTVTEVFIFLRVLFVRIGHCPGPQCGQGVPPLTVYPGQDRTEGRVANAQVNPVIDLNTFEAPQCVGRRIAALTADPAIAQQTGKILITAVVTQAYALRDVNGNQPKVTAGHVGVTISNLST